MGAAVTLAGCGKMQELCHSGARAPPASPETRNTDQRNQSLGLCSWVPGPALTGRPGMTREFFSILLVLRFIRFIHRDAPALVFPAKAAVRKFTIGWTSAVRPSRQLLRSFLRMRDFLNATKGFPHAEEHPKGASRSTHPRCTQFPDSLEGRDPCVAWAPAFAGVAETLMSALVCSCRVNLLNGSEH